MLNTPSDFDRRPYAALTNQWGHYSGGAAVFLLFSAAWFALAGEMPLRYILAGALIAAYAIGIEVIAQGWRGKDSIEDTLFVSMGALTVAVSAQEVAVAGGYSIVQVDVTRLAVAVLAALAACIGYAWARLK